jgi:hypothetical protein
MTFYHWLGRDGEMASGGYVKASAPYRVGEAANVCVFPHVTVRQNREMLDNILDITRMIHGWRSR